VLALSPLASYPLKQALFEAIQSWAAPILQHYNKELETRIETNTSDSIVARVLSQKYEDQ
jgi:hypothetical protein